MREMVLNHASLVSPDRGTAIQWLRDLAAGITQLIQHKVVESTLRMSKSHTETLCMADWTLWDALLELQGYGAREEFRLFATLTSKIPLDSEIDEDDKDQFLRCEVTTVPSPDDRPLVLCAITNGVAVGFPSSSMWDKDQLTITLKHMLHNGSFDEFPETIDNISRSAHAQPIYDRHRSVIQDGLRVVRDGVALWVARDVAFPNLTFGPDVEGHLARLNPRFLGGVVVKLASLDDSVAKWHEVLDSPPSWEIRVTDESESVKNDAKLRELRRFASTDGTHQLFMWHAGFGGGGRIHFRLVSSSRRVEIGYVGPHLPTKLFG